MKMRTKRTAQTRGSISSHYAQARSLQPILSHLFEESRLKSGSHAKEAYPPHHACP